MSPQAGELLVEEITPRIRSLMPWLNPVGAEDRQELAQDAIATAAALLASTQARGKQVSAGNLSYYAVKLVRQGRRSTGQSPSRWAEAHFGSWESPCRPQAPGFPSEMASPLGDRNGPPFCVIKG